MTNGIRGLDRGPGATLDDSRCRAATSCWVKPVLSLLGLLVATSAIRAQGAPDSGSVYAEERLSVFPVVLRQPPAVYPDSLRRAGIGGVVQVSVVLDTKGHPEARSVHVVSSPDTGLNGPAEDVVLGARFTPGRIADRKVRAQLTLSVEFDPREMAKATSPVYNDADPLMKGPALLHGPPLYYPSDLRERQIQGRVVVQMIIDTLGRPEPESIQFVELPDDGFRLPVTQYMAGLWFRPALRGGRPVRCIVYLPIDFRLRGSLFPCPVNPEFRVGCRP